jgi:hypothetical protein
MPGGEVAAAAYRLHAAMCTEIAERTSDFKNRLVLLKMAAAWLTLAEQAEKNSQVYKTPEPLQSQQQSRAEVSKTQD